MYLIVGNNGAILVIGLYAFSLKSIRYFGYLIVIRIHFYDLTIFFVFSFLSMEKTYRTLNNVFHHFSEYLKICQKYLAVSCLSYHSTSYVISFKTSNTVPMQSVNNSPRVVFILLK